MSADRQTYKNFVRASSPSASNQDQTPPPIPFLRGEDARRMYLEEVKGVKVNENYQPAVTNEYVKDKVQRTPIIKAIESVRDKDLFIAVQNNDINVFNQALHENPAKINILDDYGWSLLMIACQANAVDIVKVLLKCGADTSIRDKAGNSARSLVIKNKNIHLATILLDNAKHISEKKKEHKKQRQKEEFKCESCNNTFPDKQEHLSSTFHNINASKGKKITSSYKIPETNKGFQMMLKRGWDKDSGLGASGEGRRYPIRPVEKKDRKGLGLKKKVTVQQDSCLLLKNIKSNHKQEYRKNKNMEINFRREFY